MTWGRGGGEIHNIRQLKGCPSSAVASYRCGFVDVSWSRGEADMWG